MTHADLAMIFAGLMGLAVFIYAIADGYDLGVGMLLPQSASNEAESMRQLRQHKAKGALLIALADLTGVWELERVTLALSELAERCLYACIHYLLTQLESKGELQFKNGIDQSGIIVLGMGKLGGKELNYSSDVDLVLLYDPNTIEYSGRHSLQHCLNRFAQDLCRLMQERTADGYVFRTDLRLRPDPSSTPLIMQVDSAMRYYESVGQNWERAAFIKARPVAGDYEAGNQFLSQLRPFIWRKNLDFEAIADIHSLKRQMDNRQVADISAAGHNIKTGIGGIREIEFIAQISQLIWGGKQRNLRTHATCETLHELATHKLLKTEEVATLTQLYREYRRIEHRLQMMQDHQTHRLPESDGERAQLAAFAGYDSLITFDHTVEDMIRHVHHIYSHSFDNSPSLTADGKPLSFTGVEADNQTIATIEEMGFRKAEQVVHTIQQWHRGTIRATRTERARQLLTEITPLLLEKFSHAVDPDHAFSHFADFLGALPAGVQLFSLFYSNPALIDEVVRITGTAPGLAAQLSRHPEWLEIILSAEIQNTLTQPPNPSHYLELSTHSDDALRWLCRFRNEWDFLVGIEILRHNLTPLDARSYMSASADSVLRVLLKEVKTRFEEDYGTLAGGQLAIIAVGRLGSEELTFGSDLDLLFVYHCDDASAVSSGRRSFPATVYYNRLCQRLVSHLEAMTAEGKLYDVDTRLRPNGKDGMLAVSLDTFRHYYHDQAWTFEKMALIKSRIVAGDEALAAELATAIGLTLTHAHTNQQLREDILDIRQKVAAEFPPQNHWNTKHARGGLMDITFIANYCALRHGHADASLLSRKIGETLQAIGKHEIVTSQEQQTLLRGLELQEQLLGLLRLCQKDFSEDFANRGLKDFLLTHTGHESFSALREELISAQAAIYAIFSHLIGEY